MAHVYQVPPIPGVEDLYGLLLFLTDTDKYEKRLDALEALRAEINGLIEKVGKAEDIEELLGKAATDRKLAVEALDTAKSQAQKILADANRATEIEANESASKVALKEASLSDRTAKVYDQEVAVLAREQAVTKQLADVVKREADASRVADAADKKKDEYDTKIMRLKAAGVV